MDADAHVFYHQSVLSLMSAIRRRVADMQDGGLLDSLSGAFADAKLRLIHDELRELLDFLDATEGV